VDDEEKKSKHKEKDNIYFDSDDDDVTPIVVEPTEPATGEEDKKEEWTQEKIDKKLKDLLKERGRTKNYVTKQVQEHIKTFRLLLSKTVGLARQLHIRFHIINALFDSLQGTRHAFNNWKQTYNEIYYFGYFI